MTPRTFGAYGNGTDNDSDALKRWIDRCILRPIRCHWTGGRYLVTSGTLDFDLADYQNTSLNPNYAGEPLDPAHHVNLAWPNLTTDGAEKTVLLVGDRIEAPILRITNGTQFSVSGRFWNGGSLGGIQFQELATATLNYPRSDDAAPSRHALVLRGLTNTAFAHIKCQSISGDCIHVEKKYFDGFNPDPYHVAAVSFASIDAIRVQGYCFHNANNVGFTASTIGTLFCTHALSGGFKGAGAGNSIQIVSMGDIKGWAFDLYATTGSGPPSRFVVGAGELDNVENGFRINRALNVFIGSAGGVRFVHRHHFSGGPGAIHAFNKTDRFWPRNAVYFDADEPGDRANVGNLHMDLLHRIDGIRPDLEPERDPDTAGHLYDLGLLAQLTSIGGNLYQSSIHHNVLDNAGLFFDQPDRVGVEAYFESRVDPVHVDAQITVNGFELF